MVLFILSFNSSEPYSRAFSRDSSSKLIMEIMFVFHWQEIDRARKKFDFNTWVSQSF